ncbi:MAG: cyclic nucleotide-binding domain-containing protein [Deltaproteobacteria bacterium]|nr:cyclic nucleotide-binding domain-containing protein [Deltaproteobacteria bacterium]
MDHNPDVRVFLESLQLTKGFSAAEFSFIEKHILIGTYKGGEFVIHEGDRNSDLYILRKGDVELLRETEGADEPLVIGTIGTGEAIGELSFLDDSPRSASVRAKGDIDVVIIPKSIFVDGSKYANQVLRKLYHNIALLGSKRLRSTSLEFVRNLQRQVELLEDQVKFGTLFVCMIILFGLNGIVLDVIQNYFGGYYYIDSKQFHLGAERVIAWIGFFVFAAPVALLIKKIGFPIREVLDVRKDLKRTLIESSLVAGGFAVAAFILTAGPIVISGVPRMTSVPTPWNMLIILTPDYLLHSYIQELVARGIMQNAIQKFLKDERGIKTVMVLSVAFGVMHAHLGLKMVLGSAVASIGFGLFYLRNRNLVGVTIIHYAIGVIGRYLKVIAMG